VSEHLLSILDRLRREPRLSQESRYFGSHLRGSGWKYAEATLDWIRSGRVRTTRIRLPARMPHTTWLEQFSGGNTHRHLCALAVEVMESRGVSKWLGEAGYPGGVSDVIASDKSIVAECGNDTVHKIVPALRAGMSFVALPYWSAQCNGTGSFLRRSSIASKRIWSARSGVIGPQPGSDRRARPLVDAHGSDSRSDAACHARIVRD